MSHPDQEVIRGTWRSSMAYYAIIIIIIGAELGREKKCGGVSFCDRCQFSTHEWTAILEVRKSKNRRLMRWPTGWSLSASVQFLPYAKAIAMRCITYWKNRSYWRSLSVDSLISLHEEEPGGRAPFLSSACTKGAISRSGAEVLRRVPG
jgi:hypothetical protein